MASVPAALAGWFDTSNRAAVRYFYSTMFAPARPAPMGWTGNLQTCSAGGTSQAYRDAVALTINWVRALAGVPAGITLDPALNSKDQDMALMISANKQLSHSPPATWSCYSAAGAQAASNSNICYWYGPFNDPGCVESYMRDNGANNTAVGHRRWLLYPQAEVMGTGDVSETGSSPDSFPMGNALWVIPSSWPPRPATRDEFVSWPPKGYVPYQLVPPRWSFSFAGANFSSATVSMTRAGAAVPVQFETVQNGYGENTLAWIADNMDATAATWPRPVSDTTITVVVSGVLVSGQARSFPYQVTIFDPDSPAIPTLTATAAFRDAWGGIQITRYGSGILKNAGGVFGSEAASAQGFSGETLVAARDTFGSLWANVFSSSTLTWGAWTFGGGITQGSPAMAVATNGTAYIAVRDTFDSYWLTSYTPAGGFGSWIYLAGIFSTDPVMCAAPDGSVYVVGKDTWRSLWSGRYIPASGFQGWQWGQGIVKGKPSVACGTDSAAYVAVRDDWDSLWMARVSGNTWAGWYYGGGIMSGDPQAASAGAGTIYAVLRDTGGGIWYRGFTQGTGSNWQSWVMTGGVLQDFSPGGLLGGLYIAGRDANNDLWWYRTGSGWTLAGNRGVAAGSLAAAPR